MMRESEAGFSLVEMLVSLALLSLMTIYALSALSSLKRFNDVAARLDAQAEADAAAAYMAEELSGAALQFKYDERQMPSLLFDGKPDAVTFVIAADGRRETGSLYLVTYFVDEKRNLLSRRQMLRASMPGAPMDVILLRNVSSIELGYDAGDGKFASSWTNSERLPRSTTLKVHLSNKDNRRWPAVTVRIATANQM
jgi:general secretion pathway protein J